jgi:prepilin-type processing-associated H-X9-DG protein
MSTALKYLLGTLALFVAAVVLFPVFVRRDPRPSPRSSCQSNLKQIGLGLFQYIQDYDERFPPVSISTGEGWGDVVQPYLKSWQIFQCPSARGNKEKSSDYFYNALLANGKFGNKPGEFSGEPAQIVALGDGPDDGPTNSHLVALPTNVSADANSFVVRHNGGLNLAFADGHVRWYRPEQAAAFRFDPR